MTGRYRLWATLTCCRLARLLRIRATEGPIEPDAYTAYVAKLLADEAPELSITVEERLTLGIKVNGSDSQTQANLDRIWEFCRRNQRECDEAINDYVRKLVALVRDQLQPIEAAMLRVVVRAQTHAEQVRKTPMSATNATADQEPIVQRLVGDLWLMCVAHKSTSMPILNKGDLRKMGLTVDEAIALGQRNVSAALQRTSDAVKALPLQGFGFIDGNDYEASRILVHGDWAQVAASMKGDLIVAVPGDRLTVYGDSGRPGAEPAMAAFARHAMTQVERPISATLFCWTPAGWKPVKR